MNKVLAAILVEASGSPLLRMLAGGSASATAVRLSTGIKNPAILGVAFVVGSYIVKESSNDS